MNQNNLHTSKTKKTSSKIPKVNIQKLKDCIKNMNDETKFKFWIKTLISEQNTIPEIIRTVDKIIEIQASSVSFSSDIFNKNCSTINQVERVIDLSERKNSLVNIYVMTQKMLKTLSADDYDFLERKFIYDWGMDEIADYYSISLRTVYRKIDKLIKTICNECFKQKWSLKFIESQIKHEDWLKEKWLHSVSDYYKNSNYKLDQEIQNEK